MNINSLSDSEKSQCTVTSKHFSGPHVMDESLSHFKEKKKRCAGPKNSGNSTTSKTHIKRASKRIKGQKDIRSALKSKKNELVTYTNDFNKICQQSGIDIDSNQLQLAIAISNSLQTEESSQSEKSQSSKPLTAQERTGKIRTTLLEYGFHVPDIKPTSKNKRQKRFRKDSKLILSSDAEKAQIISDRYAQVLLENIGNLKTIESSNYDYSSSGHFYHIATNTSYKQIKSDESFYVKDLVEISSNSTGCLLKNWAEIPGRPISPMCKSLDIAITNIDCSQDELDVILSGSIKIAQEIVKNMHPEARVRTINEKENYKIKMNCSVVEIVDCDSHNINQVASADHQVSANNSDIFHKVPENEPIEIVDKVEERVEENPRYLSLSSQVRSCSPDIFDDEVSSIIQNSQESCKTKDITKCNSTSYPKQFDKETQISQLSPRDNVTKRRSNDFMEITDCVIHVSQPQFENNEENINLTQIDHEDNARIVVERKNIWAKEDIQSMDLTQSSKSDDDELPCVQISGRTQKSLDDTIILNDEANLKSSYAIEETIIHTIDKEGMLETCNNSRHDFVGRTQKSLDETIILNDEANLKSSSAIDERIIHTIDKVGMLESTCKNSKHRTQHTQQDFEEIISDQSCDLTIDKYQNHVNLNPITIESDEESDESKGNSLNNNNTSEVAIQQYPVSSLVDESYNQSETQFFDEFIHHHSESSENTECTVNDNSLHKSLEYSENDQNKHTKEISDIDLTQNTDSSDEVINVIDVENSRTQMNSTNADILGKKNDVSVDYDEMFDNLVENHTTNSKQSLTPSNVVDLNITTEKTIEIIKRTASNSNSEINSSQNSEVFEISDNELDYSLHKSRHENKRDNFELGGLSLIYNLTNDKSSTSTSYVTQSDRRTLSARNYSDDGNEMVNKSLGDSFLPEVDIKGVGIYMKHRIEPTNCDTIASTPFKEPFDKSKSEAKTPTNNDYIVKMDQVTPQQDYESLSTPERNKELDKYGLKPFKRKRAIQLLTHIYNQTHPFVEECSENLPSPSKKLKPDDFPKPSSPKKLLTSPKKPADSKSPRKPIDLSPIKSSGRSPRKSSSGTSPRKAVSKSPRKSFDQNVECSDKENVIYEVTNERPNIRNIECSEDEWVFQKREKAKVHSCRVPLHIAFHNYVSCRRGLREAILKYEPVNIDVIHRGLVANGLKYDPKDLLKFMDKKCITVKTSDNNARNKKHY